jgi:predicted nuclease of restriction endonuclease-like (RecB) superfamily
MTRKTRPSRTAVTSVRVAGYDAILAEVTGLLESARRASARVVNAVMTATYWEVGRRIVEYEQSGAERALYGEELLQRLSDDLTRRFGRGFGVVNLTYMRRFYAAWPPAAILQTPSEESISPLQESILQTLPGETGTRIVRAASCQTTLTALAARFPLPWSHYVRLLSVENPHGRQFYETEALRGGWSVRQLDRQIGSQFYERTALSRNKAAMLKKGGKPLPQDALTAEDEIKDPFVLEFLGLRNEYSESDLEDALIGHMEAFLLELGGDFTFVARQRRLRIGDEWLRIDLLFFHRRLRCLVIIDLKLDRFTHADAGQMHLYLNYARRHWTHPDENPPVGLILCAEKNDALAQYSLEGLPNKVLAAEYRTVLPKERLLVAEINRTRAILERRRTSPARKRGRR